MINLIPKEEQRRMTKDFYYRLAFLFFIILDFCVVIAFVGMTPAFFLSSVKDTSFYTKLEVQKNKQLPLSDQQTLTMVKDINGKLDLLEKIQKDKFLVSVDVINAIILKKRPDIKITQILYENDVNKKKKISISGIAPSREVLLLFRKALEEVPTFQNVDLPISNFLKDKNIQFSLSLIPA